MAWFREKGLEKFPVSITVHKLHLYLLYIESKHIDRKKLKNKNKSIEYDYL